MVLRTQQKKTARNYEIGNNKLKFANNEVPEKEFNMQLERVSRKQSEIKLLNTHAIGDH